MPWFKVDDSFWRHQKIRKVAAKAPAALALWSIAGSWSSEELTEGFIPDDELPWLIPGAEELAKELVAARLWKREKGGYRFHDWLDRNPSREQVLAEREAAKERMARLRARRSDEQHKGSSERSGEQTGARRKKFNDSRTSKRSSTSAGARASPECPTHVGQPADHCGPCRSERLGAT